MLRECDGGGEGTTGGEYKISLSLQNKGWGGGEY